MVQRHGNIVVAIFSIPNMESFRTRRAFNDPLIDNKDTKRYRADVLVEEYIAKIEGKIQKDVDKAKKFGMKALMRLSFVATNACILVEEIRGCYPTGQEALSKKTCHFTVNQRLNLSCFRKQKLDRSSTV